MLDLAEGGNRPSVPCNLVVNPDVGVLLALNAHLHEGIGHVMVRSEPHKKTGTAGHVGAGRRGESADDDCPADFHGDCGGSLAVGALEPARDETRLGTVDRPSNLINGIQTRLGAVNGPSGLSDWATRKPADQTLTLHKPPCRTGPLRTVA